MTLDIAFRTCWTVVDYFMPILSIQTLVLFLSGKEWFHGMLFVYWDIYDILLCPQYCATIPIVVPLGGKLTLTSNISYLMKGWCERSIFNVGRVEIFVPRISSEPSGHPWPNLLLCSSSFIDEQHLSFLVFGSHHFIVALMFV